MAVVLFVELPSADTKAAAAKPRRLFCVRARYLFDFSRAQGMPFLLCFAH
jgi:hypothetical protein